MNSNNQIQQQECILCAQIAQFIGIGQCNHQPICFRCIYKMRVISKNSSCPICKTNCKQVIIMPTFQNYQNIIKKKQLIADKIYGDIFYINLQGQKAFEKLTQYKCFIKVNGKPCKNDKKFPSIAFLKRHLKQEHHRHMCDICNQKKTCVLEQQKLYTFNQLNKHLQRGDIDQFGNIVFLHPYCQFCKKHFFDDDQFKVHINLQHIICNVCGPVEKYRYYKNYDSLETHFKISHYICMQKECLDKKFIAFKGADQLKFHRMSLHDKSASNGNKKIDIKQLCGFQSEGYNPHNQVVLIKDKEGIDMENQFLSLKKTKNRTLGEADQQQDQLFDIRDFYNCGLDQDQHLQKILNKSDNNKEKQQKQEQKNQQKNNKAPKQEKNQQTKKKKYISKQQAPQKQQKPIQKKSSYKQKSNKQIQQNICIQDLLLVQSLHFSKLQNQQFDSKIKNVLRQQDFKKINDLRSRYFKRKIKQNQFMEQYIKIFKNCGNLKFGLNIFPHFIRTILREQNKYDLDQQFLIQLKKLPCQHNSLIKNSPKYSDFFNKFLKQIQLNIEKRIVNGILSIKKPVKKNKQRLYQIVGVVRRIKIHQMSKLKFGTNFGLQKDTIDYLITKIFKKNMNQIQQRLDKIQNDQFLDLYVFIKYCYQAIKHKNNMHIEKHKIHQNILEDFIYERSYLEEKYGLKKDQLKTMEQKVEFEKLEQQKKAKKQLKEIQLKNKSYGFTNKADFNLGDKGDFPELGPVKKSQQQSKNVNLKELHQDAKSKPVTYQKKINQLFPTLQEEIPQKYDKKKSSNDNQPKIQVKQQKKQKAWWQKINEKKKSKEQEQQQEELVVKVRQGKNKKQKWVSVKMDGMFGAR